MIEDYLDGWPGTLIVVSHDRYFLERITDYTYAMLGDGSVALLPGGVDEYLERRAAAKAAASATQQASATAPRSDAATQRQRKKDLARIEGQLEKVTKEIDSLHAEMADAASDFERLGTLDSRLRDAEARLAELEEAWLEAAE